MFEEGGNRNAVQPRGAQNRHVRYAKEHVTCCVLDFASGVVQVIMCASDRTGNGGSFWGDSYRVRMRSDADREKDGLSKISVMFEEQPFFKERPDSNNWKQQSGGWEQKSSTAVFELWPTLWPPAGRKEPFCCVMRCHAS